jgi:putative transposase
MPDQLRVEYPGAIYHVMSRGNGQGGTFFNDVDRPDFLETLAEVCQKNRFQVRA